GPIFDLARLAHLNGLWIRSLPVGELRDRIVAGGFTRHAASDPTLLHSAVALVHDRLTRLGEFDELTGFFFEDPAPPPAGDYGKTAPEAVRAALSTVADATAALADWDVPALEAAVRGLGEAGPLKKRDLFMALR